MYVDEHVCLQMKIVYARDFFISTRVWLETDIDLCVETSEAEIENKQSAKKMNQSYKKGWRLISILLPRTDYEWRT